MTPAKPCPDEPAKHRHQRKLERQSKERWYSPKSAEQPMSERHTEQACTQETGRKAAEQAGTIEQFGERASRMD